MALPLIAAAELAGLTEATALARLTALTRLGNAALSERRSEQAAIPLPITSTAIAEAAYVPASGELRVTFRNGRTYTHPDVPLTVVAGFAAASSQGSYYVSKIKGRY